jgi:phenylacetate-CoA ligase
LQTDHLLALHIECCSFEDLPRHPRSGKCLRVLDLRCYGARNKEVPDGTVDSA